MKFGSDRFAAELESRGLQFIAQIFSSGPPPVPDNTPGAVSACGIEHPKDNLVSDTHNVARHCAVWAAQVHESLHLKRVLRSITSHTGRDYFTASEADEMLSFCEALEAETGAPVYHGGCRRPIAVAFARGQSLLLLLCAPCAPVPRDAPRAHVLLAVGHAGVP